MPGKKEFGDYQTPKDFAEKICRFLKEKKGVTNVRLIDLE